MVTATERMAQAGTTLDTRVSELDRLARYYRGQQAAAYMSPEAKAALRGRLGTLPVNLVRTAADTIADRLTVEGFLNVPAAVWEAWRRSGMVAGHAAAHGDSILYGTGYASVWTGPDGRAARIAAESPRQCVVDRDPASGESTWGVKRWKAGGWGRAVLFEPDRVTRLRTASKLADGEGAVLPVDGWVVVDVLRNPLDAVPLVALPNKPSTDRPLGESEVTDVLPLVDALSKLAQDLMVTAESHSRPRRWVTGLEVVTDEDDQPIDPFGESPNRVWQSEDPATKFGEFGIPPLTSFTEATAILLRAVAAVTALPPATVGLTSDTPASAEALRASEAGLVTRCRSKQAVLGQGWAQVARLTALVATNVDPGDVEVSWADAESRSEIVAADRAAKLSALGLALEDVLDDLGWSPSRIERAVARRRAQALEQAAANVVGGLGIPR